MSFLFIKVAYYTSPYYRDKELKEDGASLEDLELSICFVDGDLFSPNIM